MAITTTTNRGATTVLKIANRELLTAFGPNLQFARLAIENGVEHQNGVNAQPGDPVQFTINQLLNPNSSTLSETPAGETPTTMSAIAKNVSLLEKGDYVETTRKLESLDSIGLRDIPRQLILQSATSSTDQYAMEVAEQQAGANYNTYVGGAAKSDIQKTDVITSAQLRADFNKLSRANVPRIRTSNGSFYLRFVHPDTMVDLRGEAGNGSWREALLYADPSEIIVGETGAYEGFRFIETTAVKTDYASGNNIASTTATGAQSAGATNLVVAATAGITAGNIINVNDGTYDWALLVKTVVDATNLTIDKAVRKDGFTYYASDDSGLPTALTGGEAVTLNAVVYSNYSMGLQAFGYGYAVLPEILVNMKNDPYNRTRWVSWYALHGIGELRPEALHKTYCSSSVSEN